MLLSGCTCGNSYALQLKGMGKAGDVDARANSLLQPINMYSPAAARDGNVGLPSPAPDDALVGYLLPLNESTRRLNGIDMRHARRYQIWRRPFLTYELRWMSRELALCDQLVSLK